MNLTNTVLEVDREHRALQATIILSFFLGALASYSLISLALQVSGVNLIAAAVALGAGFLISKGLEFWLKDRWRSGRRLHLETNRYYTQKRQRVQQDIQLKSDIDLLFWRFTIKRGGRIPKGWYLLGCALQQDGNYLPVYSFMPATEFEQLPQAERFIELSPKKRMEKDGDLRLLGQQKRLHTAEIFRWNEGAELSRDDFRLFLVRIATDSSRWGV